MHPHLKRQSYTSIKMRSQNRAHDRDSFCKYMSAATAAIVLRNCSLRWSSPILFNDPFDVPREMSFGLTPGDLVAALARRVADLIQDPPSDTSDLQPELRVLVEVVKNGATPEVKAKILDQLRADAESFHPAGDSLEALRAMWRALLPDLRILCLTESPAHTAMWYHYADRYQGVVLEFNCDDELDSAWLAAKPVSYPVAKPAVYTAAGWAELLTSRNELAIREILRLATYTKASDWSYENEWRIASKKRPDDVGPFTDYKFHPNELSGIYLGPNISATDRNAVLTLVANYPRVKIWRVTVGMSRELEFTAEN